MTTQQLVKKVNSYGWVVFYRPRKKTISVNGGRDIPESEGREKLKRMIHNYENGLTVQQLNN